MVEQTVLDQTEPTRKDLLMIGQTPTSLKVNDFFIRETLAKAERYHALTRNDAVAEAQPVTQPVVRMRRISVIRRLATALPRPA